MSMTPHISPATAPAFTQIPNLLLEALALSDLTKRQFKVLLAVVRKTYGFHRSLDWMTNTQLAELTGLHHTCVCSAKNELITLGFLCSKGRQVGINPDVSQWQFSEKVKVLVAELFAQNGRALEAEITELTPEQRDAKQQTNISGKRQTLAESANPPFDQDCLAESANLSFAESANSNLRKAPNTKESIQNKKHKKTRSSLLNDRVKAKTGAAANSEHPAEAAEKIFFNVFFDDLNPTPLPAEPMDDFARWCVDAQDVEEVFAEPLAVWVAPAEPVDGLSGEYLPADDGYAEFMRCYAEGF
ncbi:MAG: replication protein [Aeromonas sp.]